MDRLYVCTNSFDLAMQDEEYHFIEENTEWKLSNEIGESEIRLYLVGGECDLSYIDITKERLKKYFVSV